MKRLKEFFTNRKKEQEKYKNKIMIICVGVLLLVILLTLIINSSKNNINKLEKIKIEEVSNDIMSFMEEIEDVDSKEVDKYISYALEYSYNFNDKNELTVKEIKDLIESKFTIKLKEKDIKDIGITPLLLDKNIYHNPEENKYSIDKSNITQPMIAKIPITTYEIDTIERKKDKYIITYDKYVVSNPYEVLNYYNDNNIDSKQSKKIMDYLTCKGKITSVKEAINKDNITKVGKIKESVIVTYILKKDKLLVDSIS